MRVVLTDEFSQTVNQFVLFLNLFLLPTALVAQRMDMTNTRTRWRMDPHFPRNFFFLGRAYEQNGMYEDAISATQQSIALSGGYTLFKASLGHIYGMAGERGEAQRLLNELREQSQREYVSPVAMALIHTGLGERAGFRLARKGLSGS